MKRGLACKDLDAQFIEKEFKKKVHHTHYIEFMSYLWGGLSECMTYNKK